MSGSLEQGRLPPHEPDSLTYRSIGLPGWHETVTTWSGDSLVVTDSKGTSRAYRPTAEAQQEFWDIVEKVNVWAWRKHYFDYVMDGHRWELEIRRGWHHLATGGSNAYPPGFDVVTRALESLIGVATFGYRLVPAADLRRAADVLSALKLPPETAIPLLTGALRDPADIVRRTAVQAFADRVDLAAAAVNDLIDAALFEGHVIGDLADQALKQVKGLGPHCAAFVVERVVSEKQVQNLSFADWFVRRFGEDLQSVDAQVRPALASGLQAPQAKVRAWCVDQLRLIGLDADVARSIEELLSDQSDDVREAALRALARFGPADRSARWDEVRGTPIDPALTARRAAQQAIGRQSCRSHVPRLVELLDDPKCGVRKEAAAALAQAGPEAAAAIPGLLSIALRDKDDWTRDAARTALHAIALDGAPALLFDALRKAGPVSQVRAGELVDDAFARRYPQAVPLLTNELQDENALVRWCAIRALAKIGGDAAVAVPALIEMAQTDPDLEVRTRAVRALGELGPASKSAVPVLEELSKSTASVAIRVDAKRAVQQIQNESAGK